LAKKLKQLREDGFYERKSLLNPNQGQNQGQTEDAGKVKEFLELTDSWTYSFPGFLFILSGWL
jgi:hypothetical protein